MKTTKRIFRVDRKDINYIRTTVESYNGMAVIKTLDPSLATIEIRTSPGCEKWVSELLDYLIKEERIDLLERDISETTEMREEE